MLTAGTTYTITWSSRDNVGVTSHDVLFSSNGGSTYTAIATNLAGSVQSYNGTVPNTPTTAGKIKVVARDAAGNQGNGVSGTFTIVADTTAPGVTVTSPNGGEVLEVSSAYKITWTASDNVGVTSQDVLYSTNGGTSFSPVATDLGGTVRSFSWRVPCEPTNAGRIKVVARDASGNQGNDISDGNFRITSTESTPPSVTVTYPNGGEILMAGGSYVLTWDSRDNVCVASQDLYYSSNSGATFSLIAANLSGNMYSYSWTAPTTATTAGKIKVVARDAAENQGSDVSDGNFTIQTGPPDTTPPSVTVTQPNGGETLGAGCFYTIKWVAADNVGVASQDVLFSSDGGASFNTLASNLPGGARSYNWLVPNTATTTGRIKVVVRDAAGNQASDVSDNNFTIGVFPCDTIPPTVDILSPDGGESLIAGRTYKIMWSSEDNDGVVAHDVYYSTDGGVTFTPITTSLPGIRRSYDWLVPSNFTDLLRIKVIARDSTGNAGSGISQGNCSILTLQALEAWLGIQSVEVTLSPPEEGYPQYAGVPEPRSDQMSIPTDGEPDDEDLILQSDCTPPDADRDCINDNFERILARSFDPFYVWSNDDPNNFCFLADRPDELQCTGFVSHTTPLVHYRVHFISVVTRSGVPVYRQYIIDYLTIWDRDAGLCTLGGASAHDFDVERTAALVITTVTDRHSTNIRDYFMVGIFLSAHEGVVCFDNSLATALPPIPAGNHPIIYWSKGKHANYEFPPDGYLFWTCPPADVCFVVPPTCIPSILIQECFAQGAPGARATSDHMINVGELGSPMNGSSWISVDKVRGKLDPPVIKLRNQ